MPWRIEFAEPAERDFAKLAPRDRQRVAQALDRLADTGQGDVKRLQGYDPAQWHLRVGTLRIRFTFDRGTSCIYVHRILSRSGAYRD